jgi:hypothetical protein
MQVGESTFALRAGDANSYVLESVTNPKGVAKLLVGAITETSEFELHGDSLRPLHFNATESRGKGSQSVLSTGRRSSPTRSAMARARSSRSSRGSSTIR